MKNFALIMGFALLSPLALSQSSLVNKVVVTGGEYQEGTNYRLSYTVGDVLVKKMTSVNLNLTTGFQQTWALSVGVEEIEELMGITAFPNPVADFVRLDLHSGEYRDITVNIISVTGTIIQTLKFDGQHNGRVVEINMSGVKPGLYLMRISSGDGKLSKAIRLFKN